MSRLLPKRMFADIPIFMYGIVDSTQEVAENLIATGQIVESDQHSEIAAVVTALHQRKGKGRRDRSWESEELSSLIWSFVIPKGVGEVQARVRSVVVSIIQVINSQGANVRIKWPNDLIVEDEENYKKLGGVLTEIHDDFIIVGVGINIRTTFLDESVSNPTSLEDIGYETNEDEMLNRVIELITQHSDDEKFALYKSFLATLGKNVRIEQLSQTFVGKALNVADSGELIVESNGETFGVSEGDVIHLRNQ